MIEKHFENLFPHIRFLSVNFAASLKHYQIAKPRIAMTEHIHMARLSWEQIYNTQPQTIYIKLKLGNSLVKLQLTKNQGLTRKDYSANDVEFDVITNHERLLQKTKPRGDCYYTGKALSQPDSRVALSICGGLVSEAGICRSLIRVVCWHLMNLRYVNVKITLSQPFPKYQPFHLFFFTFKLKYLTH